MTSSPITSWQIDGETMETVTDFIWGGSKTTTDCDWNHEITRHLLFWGIYMTNLDSILKNRDITLPTVVHLVKAMFFPVVTYECESWTLKKAECWRIDVFELWCWRKFLRIPWTARRLNQSILKEINPEYLLEWLMLKLQWFGHLMWGANSLEKTLMLRKIEGWKRRATEDETVWMASLTQSTWVWESSRRWWNTREPGMQQFMGSQRVRHNWIATTRNSFLHYYLLQASST